ncbi:hypothetical protein [Phenylobacterium sp.]|uniref:hypothetical protein n=1 Tax=Phenylobacterium sp. TaxID=1871053 RepID=UPI00271648E9|nr:hypothetical protein [Phenylobacterium sp.]MDO8377771.1 hypothetical protein [Phenylobacterium sp.]
MPRGRSAHLIIALSVWLAWAAPAAAGVLIRAPSYVNLSAQARTWRLTDSSWGFISPLSQAVAAELETCRKVDAAVITPLQMSPNRLDKSSAEALAALRTCRKRWFEKTTPPGAADEKLWLKIMDQPLPSPLDRAKVIAFGAAPLTPDYDRTLWDWDRGSGFTSADPDSIFSWGPYKATAGHGCTFQRVLAVLTAHPTTGPMVRQAFAEEGPLLDQLIDRSSPDWCARAPAILKPVFDDSERRENFRIIFAKLAGHREIRAGYDDYFLGPNGYLGRRIARHYDLYARAGLKPTKMDFAYFLDRSLDYPPLTEAQIASLAEAVRAGRMTNWQARRLIANVTPFTSAGSRSYQIGRDAVYFVDALGQEGLDEVERTSWIKNSRLKASDVGLTEEPYAPPCDVVFLPGCPGATP